MEKWNVIDFRTHLLKLQHDQINLSEWLFTVVVTVIVIILVIVFVWPFDILWDRILSILNVLHPVIKVPIRSYRFCSTFYQHHLLRDCMIFLQFKHFKPVRLKFSYTNGSIIFLFLLAHLFIRFTLFRWWPFIICQNFPIAASKCCRKCRHSSHIYFNQN